VISTQAPDGTGGQARGDVLVVGAGPSGAVAATALARLGQRVLLADHDTAAAGTDHDVLLTGPAVHALHTAGLRDRAALRPAGEVELWFGQSPRRVLHGCGAAVCRWDELRSGLRSAATAAGAVWLPGRVTSLGSGPDGGQGVIEVAGRSVTVSARHVVLAAGGGTTSLTPHADPSPTGITCARRYHPAQRVCRVILLLPAPGAGPDGQPGCRWVLPGQDGTVTVGAVHAIESGSASPEELQRDTLARLAAADPRFAGMRPAGPLASGPLNAGFTPRRLAAGFPLTGDAAGLASPFTGEGLSGAVHSGLLAARFIGSAPLRPDVAGRRYTRRLARTYVGYFETTRHAARRYHLTWRILASGAGSDHPVFAKGRRAVLLPDGTAGLTATERIPPASPGAVLLGPFLAACDEVTLSVVRGEWPFLGRLAMSGGSLGQHRLRPAILFCAALMAGGRAPEITRAAVAAAIELAFLGAVSLTGPAPPASTARGVDWALAATVLAGDFLLAQAARLISESAPELSAPFADWLTELVALRAGQPGETAGALFGSLLEFPARIGAQLGGAAAAEVRALREFGRLCGHVFAHAEDVLAVRGERTRLDTTLNTMLRAGWSGLPTTIDGRRVSEQALATDQWLRARALAAARGACRQASQDALGPLSQLASPEATGILRDFAKALAEPAGEPAPPAVPQTPAEDRRPPS
jgi:menaquinone-9 beta-reductase